MLSSIESSNAAGTKLRHDKSLLIEGWRGVNHSYGLVNQYQILELLQINGLRLFHHDLPFFNRRWNAADNTADFLPVAQQRIDTLPPAGDAKIDCVYRISAPIIAGADDDERRTLTFMVTELGLSGNSFAVEPSRYSFFTRDENCIITPTRWSRDRIVEFGFPTDKVRIIPHGVDAAIFRPLSAEERASNRAHLGIRDDETVFVNVGGAFWNKGVDLLLLALAKLRSRGRRVRLIIKDQSGLYGVPIEQTIANVGHDDPTLRQSDTLEAISVIRGNLNWTELRALYGIADCYVSPYRAEGFNLPALEAIACGTPVIVTQGGATDDFCSEDVARAIPGQFCSMQGTEPGLISRYIAPDLDALISAMDAFTLGSRPDKARFDAARGRLLDVFSWKNVACKLENLIEGDIAAGAVSLPREAAGEPIMPRSRQIVQEDVLDLIKMIRPWSMSPMKKVRIGNDYDGGYVLPAICFSCDVVLSIGVGPDVSFDFRLAEEGALVLQFDNTVEQSPTPHRNFVFHKIGLGARSEGSYLSFADICAKRLLQECKRPLLKFDIEGAEYDVFACVDPLDIERFEIITCEIHHLDRLGESAFFAKTKKLLKTLTLHHVPVHLHANNYGGMSFVQGIAIPRVLEITLLRRDLGSFPHLATDPIPGPLDRPNHPFIPDICMNPF